MASDRVTSAQVASDQPQPEQTVSGQPESDPSQLLVAVAQCPPFVISQNGQLSGLAIYLWERIGKEMGYSWKYVESSLSEMLEAINSSPSAQMPDIGISCTSVTAEREKLIDFSHSFNETYTAIAVRETSLWTAIKEFLTSPQVIKTVFIVLGIAILIGFVFFLLEHKVNKKLFSSSSRAGRMIETTIIGLMFATSGPLRFYRFKTMSARVLSTILTLSSTFLIAGVTAVLASSFTLSAMRSDVRSLDDLRDLRVGSLLASTSSTILDANGIAHETRLDLDELVNDLDTGKLDAIVSDAAFLSYRINQGKQRGKFKSLSVLPYEIEAQNYAFILKQDSPLRESINRALLTERVQRDWRTKNLEYFGE